jgi:hypothetical protein
MADADKEIDRLYQLPLDEFTPARNALAKQLGKTAPEIKTLQKPNVPAWAVNQLYWHERALYDRLINVSERLRTEHRKLLGGKPAEIRDAENAHRDAVRAASEKVKELLQRGGQAVTPATLTAVAETLEALPASEAPGRLTRPLKRMGFEALAGVPLRPSPAAQDRPVGSTERARLTIVPKRDDPKEKDRQRRALQEQRQAEAALKRAEAAVAKAENEVSRKQQALEEAVRARDRLRKELTEAISAHQRATHRVRE